MLSFDPSAQVLLEGPASSAFLFLYEGSSTGTEVAASARKSELGS